MEVIRTDECEARRGERFTGSAWVEALLKVKRPGGIRVYRVFFEPGARTHWHIHDGEQTLYVVEGRGRVSTSDGKGREIAPGDVVYIAPGEKHWHGAGPANAMMHLAVTTGKETTWMEAVTDDEYSRSFP
jgi:quercetin dioxygenase-like cupin family protein